ncbi:MAG: DEAD/DEAH box helicase [Mycoplasmoidaceae bacterium]
MPSKVLLEKRKNLLELNKNSPELFLSKGFVNILKFIDYEQLLVFVQDPNSFEIKLDLNILLNSMTGLLNACQNNLELKAKIEELKLDYDTSKIDTQNGTDSQKTNIVNGITKDIIDEFKQIHKMCKMSTDEFYDSGKWCLWLCFGVLETSLTSVLSSEKQKIRAPMLCLPVAVKKVSDTTYTLYKRDKEFYSNEILSIYLRDKLNIKYISNEELETISSIETTLQSIASKLPNCTFNKDVHNLTTVKKTEYKDVDNAKIDNVCILGFVNPVGGKMLEDYDQILSTDYSFPQENLMFTNQGLDNLIYEKDDVMELGRLLNVSQKKAVTASLKTNTLIYGPPGTGKSEVVTSIIANNINSGFNVLISSEKKAALDVIIDRLDALKSITISVNPEDIDSFYDRIIALNDEIINANQITLDASKPNYISLVNYVNSLLSVVNDQTKAAALNTLQSKQQTADQNKNKSVLESMLNKINCSNVSVNDFVKQLYRFHNAAKIISRYYPINSTMAHVFKQEAVTKALDALTGQDNNNKKFAIIDNFVKENKPRAGLFAKKIADDKLTMIDEMIQAFTYIRDNSPIAFFINYPEWIDVINTHDETSLANELDIKKTQNDESFSSIFDQINNGRLLYSYLNEYWSSSLAKASVAAKIIKDKYLYDLKQKFLNDAKMQATWIEMVKKAHLPTKINVARFIKEYYSILKFVFPIWILSPDNVANYIPLQQHEFAVGIFDEASQMRVERSIPLIYRCTRSVVSGDDKQLRPSRFFAANISIDEESLTSEEELDNVESLLDKAKIANWSSFTLNNHYRSNSEELINFSNKYIYDNKLLCITKNGCNNLKPIEVVQMPDTTIYDRSTNTNPDEAKKVVDIVKASEQYKKIVIITFNQKQADLIEQMCFQFPFLTARIEADTIRIRSIENVQGDEADLVVISTTFGTDAAGKFIQNFGPVGQAGGKNRINVMVTRAKEKMIVVKSFKSDAITSTNNDNLYILKMFLFYIENLQENKNIITSETAKGADKVITQTVANELSSALAGLEIKTNYGIGSHSFNIAIMNQGKIELLILIDDNNDFKSKNKVSTWVDSFDQQKYYVDRGYNVLRFNEIEWNFAKLQIIDKIKRLLNK